MFIIFLIVLLVSFIAVTAVYFQSDNKRENKQNTNLTIREWWAKRRTKYNIGLIIAGFTAFIAYAFLGGILIAPYDIDFEVTLFTIAFQGVGYFFMMLIANLFYYLGPYVDKHYNKDNSEVFRHRLFNVGFWFSVALPFLIPILIVVEYFVRFAGHN
jgi:cbb3-type cytochrome oxidase subunit 3